MFGGTVTIGETPIGHGQPAYIIPAKYRALAAQRLALP
jgi:hypothetical protein